MDLRQRERTQISRPTAPPIDLDSGRLDLVRAAAAAGFVLGALIVAAGGGWLLVVSKSSYETNWFGVMLGGGISLIALTFGSVVLYVSITEWTDHRARVMDWHKQALKERQVNGGQEVVEHVSEWELSTSNPAHVLLAALSVHMRLQQLETTPWSSRRLRGAVFFAGRRVGDVSKTTAEAMGKQFALLGLVDGREEGDAGEWIPTSTDEIVRLVVKNWRDR